MKHFNNELAEYQGNVPLLFICWPVKKSSPEQSVEDFALHWNQIDHIRLTIDSNQKQISKFQLKCFEMSFELMRFSHIWFVVSRLARLLKDNFSSAMEGQSLEEKHEAIEVVEESKQKRPLHSEPESDSKLKKAIEVLNAWLIKVMNVVDEYGDEDDEDSQKVPGSKLCSLSDLANAIDRRIEVLIDLQKTIDNEQQLYRFTCERSAQIIFEENFEQQELSEIVEKLKGMNAEEPHYELIVAIQQVIHRWHLVFDKLHTLLPQLEDILSSTTQLESEYEEINRWIEEVDKFLMDAIAIGDLDLITEQLSECERLRDFTKQSIEKSFQNILSNAQEAVRILFDQSTMDDVIPVIRFMKQTWQSLGERTLAKLERLRLAKKLTSEIQCSLEHYETLYKQHETKLEQLEDIDVEKFTSLWNEMKNTGGSELKWTDCNNCEKRVQEINSTIREFGVEISKGSTSTLSKMEEFIPSTGQSNQAFERIKQQVASLERDWLELAEKYNSRAVATGKMLSDLSGTIKAMNEEGNHYERMNNRFKVIQKSQCHVKDFEDAMQILGELKNSLNYDGDYQKEKLTIYYRSLQDHGAEIFKSKYQCVKEVYLYTQDELDNLVKIHSIFESMVKKFTEQMKRFIADSKECDSKLHSLQKWLNNFDKKLDHDKVEFGDRATLSKKREALHLIQQQYGEKVKPFGSNLAVARVESKCQFIEKLINELMRKLDKAIDSTVHYKELMEAPLSDIDGVLAVLETSLADLGQQINGLEINMDIEDQDQPIPYLLSKLNEEVCEEFKSKLTSIKQRINELDIVNRKKPFVQAQTDRLKYLKSTHIALISSLTARRKLITELIELCNKINQKLDQLQNECSKLLKDDSAASAPDETEFLRIKDISREILIEICLIKEQLDMSCIQNSDILIGIEEIGARYDEIITEVAEHYVLDDDEEEEEEMEVVTEEPEESTSVKREVNEEVPTSSRYKMVEIFLDEPKKEEADVKTETVVESNESYRLPVYSFKPYVKALQVLQSTITKLCHRRIIEFSLNTNQQSLKRKALPIPLLKGQLDNLSKSLVEVRITYEQILCAATVCGFFQPASIPKSFSLSEEEPDLNEGATVADLDQYNLEEFGFEKDNCKKQETLAEYWDCSESLAQRYLTALTVQFKRSRYTFLALHLHWWLILEDTFQFNSEIRKLSDWFENVELQLTNGRLNTVTSDQFPFGSFSADLSDLNLLVVARTQPLLVTQLKTHVPDYAKLQVLYKRLLSYFSNESDHTNGGTNSINDKAQIDARNRIKHEMDKVVSRWNSIVRELAWRRECLLGLANATITANIAGYPYKQGDDAEFDKLLDDAINNELEFFENENNQNKVNKIGPNFQLDQFEMWIREMQNELDKIRSEFTVREFESALNLHLKLKDLEHDMFRQYLNWMVITQEPFITQLKVAYSSEHERNFLENEFSKVSVSSFWLLEAETKQSSRTSWPLIS